MKFSELELIEPLLNAVKEMKYDIPSPIQEQAIPAIISGRDIFGCAKTGTGKTAAFGIALFLSAGGFISAAAAGACFGGIPQYLKGKN